MPSPDVEQLLEHSGWLRALAKKLARDDSRAEDLVQETWRFALKRPPGDDRNLAAWLGRVLRGRWRDTERSEYRRRLRERRAGRRETQISDVTEVVERAELQRWLAALVLRLDEPYRDVVLLRYFEDLSPTEIARFEEVPVSTVHTRLRRALEKLRQALDRAHGGERRAWIALLGPLATEPGSPAEFEPLSEVVRKPTAVSSASSRRVRVLDFVLGMIPGGIAMSSKKVMVWAAVGVVSTLSFGGVLFWPPPERVATDTQDSLTSMKQDLAPGTTGEPDASAAVVAGVPSSQEPAQVGDNRDKGAIYGRVRNRDGSPVAGIRVRAFRITDKASYWNEETELEGDTETAENGEFELSALPVGTYFVRAISAEHRPAQVRDLELTPDDLLEVELEIQRGLAISGRVVDPDGRPVSGAKVMSTAAPNVPLFLMPRDDIVGWATEELAVTTDEHGRFRITRLPSGNRRVVAHHPDWSTKDDVVAAGSEDVRIMMRPGATISGRVIDASGEPVSLAKVSVERWSEYSWHRSYKTGAKTKSDEDGLFFLEHVAPGALELTVEAEGYPRLPSDEMNVREGETVEGVELILAQTAQVTGTLVDASGGPISGAEVKAWQVTGRSVHSRTLSDEDGGFVLAPLEAGADHRVWLEHPEFSTRRLDPFVVEEGENDLGAVTLDSGGMLSGVVVDALQSPLEGVEVVLQQQQSKKTHTDADGYFELRGLAPGEYHVKAFLSGVVPAQSERVKVSDGEQVSVEVILGGDLSVTGQVVDDKRRPVPGAEVKVGQGHDEAHAVSEAGGRFIIRGLKDAELSIEARFGDLASKKHEAVRPGDVVELVLRRTARLSGTVRDRTTGEALAEFRIYLEKSSRRSYGRGIQFRNPLGRYALDDLEPRRYVLRVLSTGYTLRETTVDLASGENRRLDLELSPGESVSGRLVDRSGRPVAGARVFPVGPDEAGRPLPRWGGSFHTTQFDGMPYAENFQWAWAEEVRTGSDGRFVLSGMPLGPTLVRVELGDFLFEDLPAFDLPEGGVDLGTVELERGSTLEGAVFGADGLPMRTSSIEISRFVEDGAEAGGSSAYFQIGKDGRFRKSGLRSGRYRLRVHGFEDLDQVVDLGVDETRQVDIQLPKRE